MQLSLQEAVQILGKTRRQVLYMIEQGRLPAKKVGGRWVVEGADLHVDETMQQRSSQKQARFKAVIEDALTSGQERRYTLRDLKAVQVATPIYRELVVRGNGWDKAAAHMRECLDQLAVGCHRPGGLAIGSWMPAVPLRHFRYSSLLAFRDVKPYARRGGHGRSIVAYVSFIP